MHCNTSIHRCSRLGIVAVPAVTIFDRSRIKSCVMTLPNDDKSDFGFRFIPVDGVTSRSYLDQFIFLYLGVLTFRDPITINEDLFRLSAVVRSNPNFETLFRHSVQVIDDFLFAFLTTDAGWPLTKFGVDACNYGSDTR